MRAKKLPMLEDLRDESDHENPTRLVLIPRSNRVDVDELMSHLFATTDLETQLSRQPEHDRPRRPAAGQEPEADAADRVAASSASDTVTRRLQHRLRQGRTPPAPARRLAASRILNLDEVIRIIRTEDEPKPVLMKRFKLSEEQADYILETRLRQLARLEEMKINGERDELEEERDAHRRDAQLEGETR